jgi:glutathione S-transferase
MLKVLDLTTSVIASSLRYWRGTSASRTVELPAKPFRLFDREGDADCRNVREALTELNLDAIIMPCPKGGNRFAPQLLEASGADKIPFMVDENTGERLGGADTIIQYLYQQYRQTKAPEKYATTTLSQVSNLLASLIRFQAGTYVRRSRPAEEPLKLYSFESSPYSRLVREMLCELELPYLLINLGKQQLADMGPANFHMTLKPYHPLPNTKRDEFFKVHGNVQVPYLEDPNTGAAMFESQDIVAYLKKTYGEV